MYRLTFCLFIALAYTFALRVWNDILFSNLLTEIISLGIRKSESTHRWISEVLSSLSVLY